jgi:mRNA interferase RelE/StbE
MKISYTRQFIKDAKKYPQYKTQIQKVITNFENALSISSISNIKKLQSEGNDYRLRIGNFRIGFSIIDEQIVFRRFLHRKDIYKYFP